MGLRWWTGEGEGVVMRCGSRVLLVLVLAPWVLRVCLASFGESRIAIALSSTFSSSVITPVPF